MVRRIIAFVSFALVIGAVTFLVYFNAQETTFQLTPDHQYTLPLGVLILAAALAGALLMFLFALMREGRHALREWRVHRELKSAERTVEYQRQARALALAGDYKQARALLTRATQKRAPDVCDIVDYAQTFLDEGDAAQARRVLEDGQKDFGNEPVLLYALAKACRAAGDVPSAIATLERALADHPSSRPMLTTLRDLLFEAQSWPRAAEVQAQVVSLDPDDEGEQNRLAGARFEAALQQKGEAKAAALKAILGRHPDFAPALIEGARALADLGDRRRALKLLERAAKRQPRVALLDTLEQLTPDERRQKLAKFYNRLVGSHPSDARVALRAARFLVAGGDTDAAEAILRNLSMNGDIPAAHALWAEIHDARSQTEEARQSYRAGASSYPRTASLFVCQQCQAPSRKWQHRCQHCGAWGSLEAP